MGNGRRPTWVRLVVGAAVLSVAASGATVSAQGPRAAAKGTAAQPQGQSTDGAGHFIMATIETPPSVARRVGLIPDRWKLATNASGNATVVVSMDSSTLTVNGRTRPVIYDAVYAVLATPLPAPESRFDNSNVEGSPEDFYLMSVSSNDPDMIDALRQGTGLGSVVQYDPALTFGQVSDPVLSHAQFSAPSADHVPFQFAGTFTPAVVPLGPTITNWWRETPAGTFRIDDRVPNGLDAGFAQKWVLDTPAQSPLGHLIGGTQRQFGCDAQRAPAPLLGLANHTNDLGCIAAMAYTSGSWRWTVIPRNG